MPDDIILSMLLAEKGCPFEAGTKDSVCWMLGFKRGLEVAKAMVEAAAYSLPPDGALPGEPPSIGPRHPKAN